MKAAEGPKMARSRNLNIAIRTSLVILQAIDPVTFNTKESINYVGIDMWILLSDLSLMPCQRIFIKISESNFLVPRRV